MTINNVLTHTCSLNQFEDCKACRQFLESYLKNQARMKKWMMIRNLFTIFYFLLYILIVTFIAHIAFIKGVLIFIAGIFFDLIFNFFNTYTKVKAVKVL